MSNESLEVKHLEMTQNLESYIRFLKSNSFWNDEYLEVKQSPIGGVGVYWKDPKTLDDSLIETILLRIPKSNILSSKNSSIYNLLVDYNEVSDSEIDLTRGIHSLIICFVYELSFGDVSPWSDYLLSIDPFTNDIDTPMCLWDENERKLLKNTECGNLGMLEIVELINFFEECVNFANQQSHLIAIPSVLNINLHEKDKPDVYEEYKKKLNLFGKCIQAVVSRAFQIDDYHVPSLVPGADLFNHLSPTIVNGKKVNRENVHFVCDGDICSLCGEIDCDHEEDEESFLEDTMLEDTQDFEDEIDIDEIEVSDEDITGYSDDNEEDEEEEDEEEEEEHPEEQSEGEEDDGSILTDVGEITMELIQQLQQEEEDESEEEDEEGGEESDTEEIDVEELVGLEKELQDSFSCVDIILTSLPQKEYDYEVFNTYGNELSNPYLLQRYGFVSETNVNDSVQLSLQFKSWLKNHKAKLTPGKVKQINAKLNWLDMNFDFICELVNEITKQESEEDDENEEGDDEDENEEDEQEEEEFPESWKVSFKVLFDGSISLHGYLIMKLIFLPFIIFKTKIIECKPSKTPDRIIKYLLSESKDDKEIRQINQSFVSKRLKAYPKLSQPASHRQSIINSIIKQEISILEKFSAPK
ncbi:ribosomal lysine N-methyltransferase 3 [[Candida] jaroonii]|uniref:Ribosomal lysine N-methyltransferase 3 n=1 Tax=[Candida] jaroonii TaxID=467808 RepID=A0ACA9Y081_9ASCO|nr:ribosomal lysine N-methyltransferase 3 [[Candida] jaroonii]